MKKIVLFLYFCLSVVLVSAQDTITLNNGIYRVDTLAFYPIGPGSTYTALQLTRTTGGLLHVYFSKVCRTNPYISFEVTVGRDSILLGEKVSSQAARHSSAGHQLFTGTNGDFYITQGDVGLPTSATICNGEYAYSPNNSRNMMAFDADMMPMLVDKLRFSGTVKKGDLTEKISHVNYNRSSNELVLYNRYQGRSTKTNGFGHEAVIELCDGEQWSATGTMRCVVNTVLLSQGNTAIPRDGAVLSAHGDACGFIETLSPGDTLTLSLQTKVDNVVKNISNALGGDTRPFMLHNGVVETNTDNIWNENHPRTAFGFSQSGDTIIMCVVDGRGVSMGCTTYTLAELMQSAGAYSAINLDGGGSSTHFVAPFGAMNRTSDGSERAVSNALFAVNTAPESNSVDSIAPYKPTIYLPSYGVYTPKILGYNTYGTLIDTDVTDFTLSCDDPAVGHIENNQFVASGNRNGFITVSSGDCQCNIYIVYDTEAEVKFRYDSVIIDRYHPYEVDVNAVIGVNTEKVNGKFIDWTVEDGNVCEVRDGVIHALADGVTIVTGALGDFSDTIKVIVENPVSNRVRAEEWGDDSYGNWTVSCSSTSWNTTIVSATQSTSAHIDFKYSSARAPFIRINNDLRLYGLPDSIGFRFNANGAGLSNVSLTIRPNNESKSKVIQFDSVATDKEEEIVIDLAQAVSGFGSPVIYPIFIETIRFNLNSKQMTSGNSYSITLDGLYLYYGKYVVSATDFATDMHLDIYPNPATDKLYVPTKGDDTIKVYDIEGRMMLSVPAAEGITEIDISSMKPGIYVVRTSTSSAKLVVK